MIPSVILEWRLTLSNEDNYLDKMFNDDAVSGHSDDDMQADDVGLHTGVQALLTLA